MAAANPDVPSLSPLPKELAVASPRDLIGAVLAPKLFLFMSLGVDRHTSLFPFLEALLHLDPLLDLVINSGKSSVKNMVGRKAASTARPRSME